MNKKNYDLVFKLTSLTNDIKGTLEKQENDLILAIAANNRREIEIKKMAAKILELEEEEYTVHKGKSYSVNSEEIASLGLALAKAIGEKND